MLDIRGRFERNFYPGFRISISQEVNKLVEIYRQSALSDPLLGPGFKENNQSKTSDWLKLAN